jgi:hypothetical protein
MDELEKIVAQYLACAKNYEIDKIEERIRALAERRNDPELLELVKAICEGERSAIRQKLQRILEQ